jgi:hypothetical protein
MTGKPDDRIFDVQTLAGETLAVQAILLGILPRLAALSPEIRAALGVGFDDAANMVEHLALKFGDQASPAHATRALQIVEGMRADTLAKPNKGSAPTIG